jgi:hypothetical protein
MANIVFAGMPVRGTSLEANLTGKFDDARTYLTRPFAPLGEMNLMPADTKVRKRADDSTRFDAYPQADLDFDGGLHGTGGMGAYALDRDRPRWLPALEIKPIPATR